MLQLVQLRLVAGGLFKMLTDLLWTTSTGSAYSGLLGKTYLGLFTPPFAGYSLGLTGAGITEPTYGGYARVSATWSTRGIDPVGRPEVYSQGTVWQPNVSGAGNQILGMAWWDSLTGGNLYGVGLLPTAIVLAAASDMLAITARFALPLDPADWGQSSATN